MKVKKNSNQFKVKVQKKFKRNSKEVKVKLELITAACTTEQNLLPLIIDAAKSYATLGEIADSMKTVFGEWKENPII